MCVPAVVAIFAASILVRMPPRDSSDSAAPAIASISEVTALDDRNQFRVRVGAGRRVVEAVDVRQQDQQIGARHGGDARGEAVVVAVADFVGGDGVVLVDHRHRAPFQQLGDGRARIEIAAALLGVLQGHQNLPGADAVMRPAPPTRSAPARSARRRRRPGFPPASAAPRGSFSRLRPSAIEPDETTSISRPSPCSLAISAASAASHDARTSPASESISSDEPTLTTMRRKFFRCGAGHGMDESSDDGVFRNGASGRKSDLIEFEVLTRSLGLDSQLCRRPAYRRPRLRLRRALGLDRDRGFADHLDQRAQRLLARPRR